jgi:hypothetical protein
MKYHCDNHRPVDAESARGAAQIIASRKARALYGKSGRVGACRIDAQSQDGRVTECEAFIGYLSGQAETTGRNVRFVLHLR